MMFIQTFSDREISLLVREINWLETGLWPLLRFETYAPYSLGKLIDWKQLRNQWLKQKQQRSLLAREINWLETHINYRITCCVLNNSLLAREINWLETSSFHISSFFHRRIDSLLAREINWLETYSVLTYSDRRFSLLAREINWLETGKKIIWVPPLLFSLLAREINWLETLRQN